MIHILTDARPECLRQVAAWLRAKAINDPTNYKVAWARYRSDSAESTGQMLARIAATAKRTPKAHRLLILVPFAARDEHDAIRTILSDLLARGVQMEWYVPKKVLAEYQKWKGLKGIFKANEFYEQTERELEGDVLAGPAKAKTRRKEVLDYLNQSGTSVKKIDPPS